MTPSLLRRLLAGGLAAAGIAGAASGALTWFLVATDLGWARVNGWGTVGGDTLMTGENLNEFTGGEATYRPGAIVLGLGLMLVVMAVGLALPPRGAHPHRIPASVAILIGLGLAGRAGWALMDPDPLDILQIGDGVASGAGPWLAAAAGLAAVVIGIVVLAGRADDPDPAARPHRRGIQPG